MIMQFPTPYKDELLYSVIARYHIRSGNTTWLHTLEDLFGKRSTNATAMLPSNITALVERLPKNSTLNESLLIDKHTLFNFYTAFLPKEKAVKVYESMLSGDGRSIYMRAGIMPSAIPQNKFYKYCSICLKMQENELGEMYWDRFQQLPGKMICHLHGTWLEDSTVPLVQYDKCSYILPNAENCKLDLVSFPSEALKEQYNQLLNQVDLLLNLNTKNLSYSEWTSFYKWKLIESGYANRNGRVDQMKLQQDFFHYYSKEFLSNMGIKTTYWLREITQTHRKSFHPYQHLLLLNFLGLTVKDLFLEALYEKDKEELIKLSCSRKFSIQFRGTEFQSDISVGYYDNRMSKRRNKIEQRRKAWLELQRQYPKLSKTELRKINPAIYSYLYRCDREWLNKNSPQYQKRKVINNRVNWEKRDREVLKKVIKATEELLNRRENLRRITIKSLGDETGESALLEKQLNKIPQTKAYIDEVKESDKDFRKRRILRVIEKMKEEGEPLKEWRVLKEAGIKSKFYDEARNIVNMFIN